MRGHNNRHNLAGLDRPNPGNRLQHLDLGILPHLPGHLFHILYPLGLKDLENLINMAGHKTLRPFFEILQKTLFFVKSPTSLADPLAPK